MCSLRLLLMQVKSFSKHFGPSQILAKVGQVRPRSFWPGTARNAAYSGRINLARFEVMSD
jgi:hypothetical protein